MAFTKMGNFTFNHAEQPDKLNLPAAETKAKLDSRANELKTAFNAAVDLLNATAAGDSGADNVGAAAIDGIEGASVQAQMVGMKGYVDAHKAENASYAHFYKAANQSIADNTLVQYNFDTKVDNQNDYCELATGGDAGKVKITKAGIYQIYGTISWATNATGYRKATVALNGSSRHASLVAAVTGNSTGNSIPVQTLSLAVNDLISLNLVQNSGGALDAYGNRYDSYLEIKRIGGV